MSYELFYSKEAVSDLARVQPDLLDFVEEHLRLLAQQPVTLSRPSAFPYPPAFQIFDFHTETIANLTHHFTVLFKYGADEKSLLVAKVGHYVGESPGF